MENLLLVLVILLSAILVITIIGLILYIRRVTSAVQNIAEACTEIRRQAVLVSADIRSTLDRFGELVRSTQNTVDTAGRVASGVERFVDGRTVAGAAEKVFSASKSTLILLGEAMKEAVKAFKTAGSKQNKVNE